MAKPNKTSKKSTKKSTLKQPKTATVAAKSAVQQVEKPDPELSPSTQMLGYGYNPWWSEGSVKPPLFLTSTFLFKKAEDGEEFFKVALGKKEAKKTPGLIYSRLNNPELEILERRLAIWEKADAAAAFASGMAAISTSILAFCRPGDVVAYTQPIYGGTDHFFQHILPQFNIHPLPILPSQDPVKAIEALRDPRLRVIYVETPSNPTLQMVDIGAIDKARKVLEKKLNREIVYMVDNTMLGPVFQQPLLHGADVSLYSATKFIGGHSDLIAGAAIGSSKFISDIKTYRSFLGSMAETFTCWLMMRSLETLEVRMRTQQANAQKVAAFLQSNKEVSRVFYPGLFKKGSIQDKIRRKQTSGDGSLISFEVIGGKERAFEILNRTKICKLAVSLGGTETLIEHPKTMTHSELDEENQADCGITDGLIRLSVGIEDPKDIIQDLKNAFSTVGE